MKQLDEYINFITNNNISFISNDARPTMTPTIQQIYSVYNQALHSENINHSVSLYESILNKTPNFVAARYNLAQIIQQHGDLDEALQQYMLAARYNPLDASIFIQIGVVFSMQGRIKEAIEAYLHILKIIPENATSAGQLSSKWRALLNLGVNYHALQDFGKSLEWLEAALNWIHKHNKYSFSKSAWDSELVATYFEIGSLYKDFGDVVTSEKVLLLGAKIAEENTTFDQDLRIDETYIWSNLGEIYLKTKRWKEAEYYFKKCLQRNPNEDLFQLLLENAQNKNFGK